MRKIIRTRIIRSAAATLIIFAGLFYLNPEIFLSVEMVVLMALLITGEILLLPKLIYKKTRKEIIGLYGEGKNTHFLEKNTVTLSPEGINKAGVTAETKISWSGVERIEESDKYLFIYISAVSALLIPREAFTDESHYVSFRQYLEKYLALALPA